jgi:hypothetical protein
MSRPRWITDPSPVRVLWPTDAAPGEAVRFADTSGTVQAVDARAVPCQHGPDCCAEPTALWLTVRTTTGATVQVDALGDVPVFLA